LAALSAAALVLLSAAPAQADDVRKRQQWVLDALNVERAWQVTKGAGVTVALLDTRVRGDLKELKGRVTEGPDMTGAFYGDLTTPMGVHGTQMASLIAGSGRGGALAGIASEARILSVPVAVELSEGLIPPREGATPDSPVARAIRYAVNKGAKVIGVPSGTFGAQRLDHDAIAYALDRGVVVVAPAGDGGQTASSQANGTSYWQFPAGYSGVIGVGAVDRKGAHAAFSSDNLSVLVSAPGVDVPVAGSGGGYGKLTSTDAAAALVTGVVALIKAKYPAMSPEQVSRALTATARGRPKQGYDDKVGFGVVDAQAALAKAAVLSGYRQDLPVPKGLRFGKQPASEGPSRPGPDPLRLWLYGVGVVLGLIAFSGGVVVLTRRSERG
jgi:subtilisin family serine protease